MGKKNVKKTGADGKTKKHGKKKKATTSPIEDATEAYRKAWESRREKALDSALKHEHEGGKNCGAGEHLILGPFFGPQPWRIEDKDPQRATTWNWLGFQSVHFCRKK